MSAPLPPAAAIARATRLLEAEGFTIVARNGRGDSLYLAPEGASATLRVSNHARRPRQRQNHPEVATSLVIHTPRSTAQIEVMVAAALRDFFQRTQPGCTAVGDTAPDGLDKSG